MKPDKIAIDGFDINSTLERMKLIERGYPFSTLYPSDIGNIVAALSEQAEREDPKPLTLKQLRERDGNPVYIWFNSINAGWWDIYRDEARFENHACMIYFAIVPLKKSYYGKTYLAYDHPPKEAQE
jgi:hypothetical protein